MSSTPTLRQRVIKGAKGQVFVNVVRVVVQVGMVSILAPTWGLQLYGEWLILVALPMWLSFSDLGFFAAARNDMIMAVGRGERDQARDVFQAVTRGVAVVTAILVVALPLLAAALPLTHLLGLKVMSESTASVIVVMFALDTVLVSYAGLLYGGFACEGHYGEGLIALAGLSLAEFSALAIVVLLGYGPAVAAIAYFGARLVGTALMYVAMRRYAPWLRFGKPSGKPQVFKRLTTAALASAAIPLALAFNIQGSIVLVGVAAGPASAAIFQTLRTMSRVVIQLLSAINSIIMPELSKAYGAGNFGLFRKVHQRGCQTAVWLSLPILSFLAVFGGQLLDIWTHGKVGPHGALLYLFLVIAGIGSLWYTSLAVLISTNRHQRVATYYLIACIVNLPLAYVLLKALGIEGAALSLVLLEAFMLVAVLRRSLPAAHETLRGWLSAIATPPVELRRLVPSLTRRAAREAGLGGESGEADHRARAG